jgi:hypothetical protein
LTDDTAAAAGPPACWCPPVVADATPAAMVATIAAVPSPMPMFSVLRMSLFSSSWRVVHEEDATWGDSGVLRER